jgi:hypothetical protein
MKAFHFVSLALGSLFVAGAPCHAASVSSSNVVIDGDGQSVVIINGQVVSGGQATHVASGPMKTEERSLTAFSSITLAAPVEMSFTAGARPRLVVSAPADVLPLLSTTVEGGRLVVKLTGSVVLHDPIRIEASGPVLESVDIAGAGDLRATGITGRLLRVEVSGSGNVIASGRAERVEARISGSGAVDVSTLQARDLAVEVSGSGDVKAYASQAAQVAVLGSGDVRVWGKPAQRSVNRLGSGQVSFD